MLRTVTSRTAPDSYLWSMSPSNRMADIMDEKVLPSITTFRGVLTSMLLARNTLFPAFRPHDELAVFERIAEFVGNLDLYTLRLCSRRYISQGTLPPPAKKLFMLLPVEENSEPTNMMPAAKTAMVM